MRKAMTSGRLRASRSRKTVYEPLEGAELEYFLDKHPALVTVLNKLDVKLTATGRVLVAPARGCPFNASKCRRFLTNPASNPAFRNLIAIPRKLSRFTTT
jgi:hypothetical protein